MKLQLTNGYQIHFNQITRILQCSFTKKVQKKIPRIEFLADLGMSERQFENLSSVSVGLGLIKRATFVLTTLGKTIAENDIFFDSKSWSTYYRVLTYNSMISN